MSFFYVFNTRRLKKFLTGGVIALAVVIVFCFTFFFGSANTVPTQAGVDKAIYKGNEANNNVSLMINVYWGNEYIEGMLDIIEKSDIKVTFFVGGSWAKKNPEILKKIAESGAEIGNHGYYHKDSAKISKAELRDEIVKTNQIIQEICGVKCTLFAPPSGSFDEKTIKVTNELGMDVIMWSKDTIDWRDGKEGLVYQRATNNVSNGDLILMHPTAHTLAALQNIVDEIKGKGFNLTDVSTNIK